MNAPIIDLRASVPLHRRLPVGLGTLALWTLWGVAIRHVLGVALVGGGAGSLLLLGLALTGGRRRPRRRLGPVRVSHGRETLGQPFGLSEVELFRAQHSRICTVFHDESGTIQRLVCHRQEEDDPRGGRALPLDPQGQPALMEASAGRCHAHSSG